MVMKKVIVSVFTGMLAVAAVWGPGGGSEVSAAAAFKDVPASHWAKASIDDAVNNGYLKGYADGTFRPSAPVTRAEFAAILSRVSSNEVVEGKGNFADLTGNWSEEEVTKAIGMGFIAPSDYTNGFKASTSLTRREMAKWMASGLATAQEDFQTALSDTGDTLVPVAEYYKGGLNKADYPFVSVALGTGLMTGYEDGAFGPAKTTTRAEVAAILSRYESVQKKKATDFRDLNEMREVGLTGTNMTSLTPYKFGTDGATGKPADFSQIRDREFKLRNNLGTQTIHRIIVIKSGSDKKPTNLYGKMFIDKDFDWPINGDAYHVFTETTLIPNGDNLSNLAFANATGNRFLSGSNFETGTVKTYGITNLPHANYLSSGFFKEGVKRKFWMYTSIASSGKASEQITINGKSTLIVLK
ncbi:S-layer homology domain-containing protein [Paenibacillus sp. P96]|uniref:S-layer homology domain-containing protein n=1 Tax=Paenibacillus zeirhizosphaerae TaxID=2987519 RepID=A0ABT9FVX8_9BACL|nr:S-layer homology domain-containing protein [Paenibacillus sp. P96]MDP4098867.1 S-layer homology domain-containing protein [Paenibacillus sp. P96]